MKKLVMGFGMLLLLLGNSVSAQTVVSDTVMSDVVAEPQPTDDHYRVVTNRFFDNWFIFGDFGGHAFFGDYSKKVDFGDKLTPDFQVGIGKWFTPGIGAKLQFGLSNSKGASPVEHWFTTDETFTEGGEQYWRTKNKWWDLSVNAMFNLSRLFRGYEGKDSEKLMNQFIASVGIGALHHRDIEAQRNEWSGHFELQYSRFFTKKKAVSLDLKAHAIMYQTNFDGITLKPDGEKSKWWDANVGISIGMTYYFKKRHWDRCVPCETPVYITNTVMPAPVVEQECPEYKTLEFYVFFPNNYSGRDDAPSVTGATVNAIDYLACGIFTQKGFADSKAVEQRLASNGSLAALRTVDMPTEKANRCEELAGVARGYEMTSSPISLSMDAASMRAFEDKADYYYAPIYEGGKTWYYRVDKETSTQSLLSGDNYRESASYGLNAHAGLKTVADNMKQDADATLYSFADVYAAIEGNEGFVAQAADAATVQELANILQNGRILYVQAEGLATSQDNYIGENAENVGLERNKTLAYNRAVTVVKWLQNSAAFSKVSANDFSINSLTDPIVTVNDKSTQGLNAKLNRSVKVRIHCVVNK